MTGLSAPIAGNFRHTSTQSQCRRRRYTWTVLGTTDLWRSPATTPLEVPPLATNRPRVTGLNCPQIPATDGSPILTPSRAASALPPAHSGPPASAAGRPACSLARSALPLCLAPYPLNINISTYTIHGLQAIAESHRAGSGGGKVRDIAQRYVRSVMRACET
jgi:hypothetical protein